MPRARLLLHGWGLWWHGRAPPPAHRSRPWAASSAASFALPPDGDRHPSVTLISSDDDENSPPPGLLGGPVAAALSIRAANAQSASKRPKTEGEAGDRHPKKGRTSVAAGCQFRPAPRAHALFGARCVSSRRLLTPPSCVCRRARQRQRQRPDTASFASQDPAQRVPSGRLQVAVDADVSGMTCAP